MMISPEQYIDGLEWRYACKKFDPEARLEQPTWHALAESLRLSPSSLGLQLWKFVVVTNRELKARLREVSWNQSQVEDCSHYVVLCSRRDATRRDVDRYLAQIEFTRRPSAEKLASSADFYTSYVEALAPEKMHAWLDCLGLDGTPYRSVVGVALGYRAKDDAYAREAKVRFPAGEVIDIRA